MSIIYTQRPWVTQPPLDTPLKSKWKRDLAFVFNPLKGTYVTGKGAGPLGVTTRIFGDTNGYDTGFVSHAAGRTVIFFIFSESETGDLNYFGYYNSNNTIGVNTSGAANTWTLYSGGGNSMGPHLTEKRPYVLGLTTVYADATNCYFNGYTNGVKTRSSLLVSNTADTLKLQGYSGLGGYAKSQIYLAVGWNRTLTDAEMAEIGENPFASLYEPEDFPLFFGASAGHLGVADSGSLTLTGSAADGLRALLSAADAGSLTLTGSAASGILARLGVADSGSLTLTGSAADALRALAGVAGSGSITLTGSDAAGVYSPVGNTPSAADSGSLTLSGSAAIGTYDRLAAADAGSLTLTGADAAGQIQAPGAYTSAADAGSLILLGYDAAGVFSGAVTLTQADLNAIAAAVWSHIIESSLSAEEMQRIMLAALAGKRVGLGTATEQYMAQDGVTPRITFTPSDGYGNGTTVVDGT